jgi:hypothetical protein
MGRFDMDVVTGIIVTLWCSCLFWGVLLYWLS